MQERHQDQMHQGLDEILHTIGRPSSRGHARPTEPSTSSGMPCSKPKGLSARAIPRRLETFTLGSRQASSLPASKPIGCARTPDACIARLSHPFPAVICSSKALQGRVELDAELTRPQRSTEERRPLMDMNRAALAQTVLQQVQPHAPAPGSCNRLKPPNSLTCLNLRRLIFQYLLTYRPYSVWMRF